MHLCKFCAAVLIAFSALAGHAQLYQSTRLDRHNIADKDPFGFTIQARHGTGSIAFSVTVSRAERTPASPAEARVMLFDGEGEIAVMHLSPLRSTERSRSYEFEVATNLLPYSQFVFRQLRYTNIGGNSVGDSFWFFLKDFAVVEVPNQAGANGRQPFSSGTNRTSAAAASRRSP